MLLMSSKRMRGEEGRKGSSEKALTRFPEIFSRLVFRSVDHLDGTSNLSFLHAFSLLSSLAGSLEFCLRPPQSQFRDCVSPATSHWNFEAENMRKGEDGSSNSQPRKLKFVPKMPSRKARKPTVANEEPSESYHDVVDKELVSKIQRATMGSELLKKRLPSNRKVTQTEVAFGHVDSKLARSFPKGKAEVNDIQDIGDGEIIPKIKSNYVDPWDYENSYYPVTLPLRRPHSGNPEILNEEEFGEASAPVALNCSKISPTEELGLMEKSAAKRMFFFQFPPTLPSVKKFAGDGGSRSTGKLEKQFTNGCKLEDLPEGLIGKIMVHRSGKMKMKLGDTLFDVYPGVKCDFAQQVAAINVKEKHSCILGEPDERVVVTPDVDSLVNAI